MPHDRVILENGQSTGAAGMVASLEAGFQIGDYQVIPQQGRIIGPDKESRVQPKIIDVLLCLAESDSNIVTREDLHDKVWGNVIVTDDALNRCISELRRVFGDKRGQVHYIETVPKRGYRLIAEIKESVSGTTPAQDQDQALPPKIETAIATIAVLPFQNQTPDSEHGFLAEAIPSSLHSSLARLNRIRVTSRRSSFALGDSEASAHELGAQLGAQYIVSGSIAEAGKRIRVIAEVDDAEAGVLLWSQRYEVDGDDVLAFEQQLTAAVVGAFGGQRLRAEISHAQEAPPSKLDAWGLVQKARAYLVGYRAGALKDARELLAEATAKDPTYAYGQAMHGLLIAENVINGLSDDMDKDITASRDAVTQALKLAPTDPAILRTCGSAQAYCGDYTAAIATLRRAVSAAPFDLGAWGYLGWPLTATGKDEDLQETVRICDRLLENAGTHPGAPYWQFHRSVALACTDELDLARDSIEACLATQPEFALGLMHYANVLGQLGLPDEAAAAAKRASVANEYLTPERYQQIIDLLTDQAEVRQKRLAGLHQAGLLTR